MSAVTDKFLRVRDRLVAKMQMSQAPVPGFIMGLSGTDSIAAFALVYEAAEILGMANRVWGIHYVDEFRRKPTWFEANIFWYLAKHCPSAKIEAITPLGGNFDPQRWADLHLRALNHVRITDMGRTDIKVRDPGENFWVCGTMNATEKALGTYTALAKGVSVQPIVAFSKTEVLQLCRDFEVPAIAEEYSRIPDCWCGRDTLAAENIELIDDILTARIDPTKHDPELQGQLYGYIRETKGLNDFKNRTPYFV